MMIRIKKNYAEMREISKKHSDTFVLSEPQNTMLYVTPNKNKIIGGYNIIEYGENPNANLPRILSDILCNQQNKTFVLIGPNSFSIVPDVLESRIKRDKVYFYDSEYSGKYVLGDNSHLKEKDILIFPSNKLLANNLRNISATSNYHNVVKHILKKLIDKNVYVPADRVDKTIEPEERYRYSALSDTQIVKKPEEILSVKTPGAIGDILLCKVILDLKRDDFDKVVITPSIDIINTWRKEITEEYKNFVFDLYDLLFRPPYYQITQNQYPRFQPDGTLFKEFGMPQFQPDLQHLLCEGERIPGEYFTLLTKVRDIKTSIWNEIKSDYFKAIRLLAKNHKIIVVGERELVKTEEYLHYGLKDSVHSIYNDIMDNIGDIVIDKTFPFSSDLRAPELKSIKQDCMYLRDSICNFSIGRGGLFVMSLCVGKTVMFINKSDKPHYLFENFWTENPIKSLTICSEPHDFIREILKYVDYRKPKTYSTSVHLGLGDIIYSKAMLDKTDYEKIIIRPRLKLLEHYNKSFIYEQHTIDLFKKFFPEPRYELKLNYEEDEKSTPLMMYEKDRIFPVKPYCPDLLCEKTEIPEESYIVIHTKVKGVPKYEYEIFKEKFFNIINSIDYKVVLLGEKSILKSSEWHGLTQIGSIYSIYADCLKYLKNYTDMTENTDLTSSSKNIYKSCYLMRNANLVVTFGVGGNFCMASATASNHIGFIVYHPFYDKIYDLENVNNGFVTKDWEKFLVKLDDMKRAKISKKEIDWYLKKGEFSFSTSSAIGELILSVHLLENDPRVEKVNMSFYNGFLKAYEGNEKEIMIFFKEFAKLLTQNCKKTFNITDTPYEYIAADGLCQYLNFTPSKKLDFPQLGYDEKPLKTPYIVITSKIRSLSREEFEKIKYTHFENLKKLSKKYKIVLIGERNRINLVGVKNSLNLCIYEDLKNSNISFIDKTFEMNGRAPKLESIMVDFTYIKHSKALILLGNGGQYCAGLANGANVFSYMGPDKPIYHEGQSKAFWSQDWCLKHTYFDDFQKYWLDILNFLDP